MRHLLRLKLIGLRMMTVSHRCYLQSGLRIRSKWAPCISMRLMPVFLKLWPFFYPQHIEIKLALVEPQSERIVKEKLLLNEHNALPIAYINLITYRCLNRMPPLNHQKMVILAQHLFAKSRVISTGHELNLLNGQPGGIWPASHGPASAGGGS